jgi:manganese-dependent inorganic pyrophosphatase
VLFWNNPVGSTSTIVTLCYNQNNQPIPPKIAGVLLAGLISDTLNLTSPTTTPVDRAVRNQLAATAGVDPDAFATELFSVGSPLLTLTAEQAIAADSKPYTEQGHRFIVAQIEELTFSHFPDRKDSLLAALQRQQGQGDYLFSALLVTDITTQTSLLLVVLAEQFVAQINYPEVGPNLWQLDGVVSRKKQLLPYLIECLGKMPPA